MILPPFAAPEGFKSPIRPPDGEEINWFIFSKDQLLTRDDKKTLPTQHPFVLERTLYIGTLKGRHFFAGDVAPGTKSPSGWLWSST